MWTDEDSNETRESLVEFLEPELVSEDSKAVVKTPSGKKPNTLPEVLNSLLPPRQYMAGDVLLQQKVSPYPSSRESVINLQMKLDERLQEKQARENGICPVREELYSQCFDELIRQITIASPERGLMLLRVRDEVRMTIAAYQTLYQSSISFGMRKTLQAEQNNEALVEKVKELQGVRDKLARLLEDEKGLYKCIDQKIKEKREIQEKKMADEKQFEEFQFLHMKNFLKDNNIEIASVAYLSITLEDASNFDSAVFMTELAETTGLPLSLLCVTSSKGGVINLMCVATAEQYAALDEKIKNQELSLITFPIIHAATTLSNNQNDSS